ncbi:tetratricopeptide repeat protein [Prochlorococcus marinus]|uniref:tetratricopeptide repeat protein n=1 Tax=Prochlorococcus marinus TaxID=1219 RepID=UPI0022B51ADB|nr:tetratricopeptide repeat protein [Prochlorococcus marinus]
MSIDFDPDDGNIEKNNDLDIYSVPFSLSEIHENINILTNNFKDEIIAKAFQAHSNDNILESAKNSDFKSSKEEIIDQAFKFHAEGNTSEAVKYYQYCINKSFNDHRIFLNFGVILRDLGKLKEAELSTRKAIELNPNFTKAHSNLGDILKDLGKLEEAELSTRKAIELKPDYAIAHSNLGNILRDLGNLKEAELSTRKAIALQPNFANAYLNLGNILKDLGKLHDAELSQRKAIDLQPNFAEAHSNLGNILRDLGNLQEAEVSTRKAIALNPNLAEAFFNLSLIQLLKGNYKDGLENYEFRLKKKRPALIHGKTKLKRIDNQLSNQESKILVVSEQGLGDTLQYMRYIPYLRKKGLDVSFSAQTKLHSLIQSSAIDQNPLTPEQVEKVSARQWIPLLSLARYLKISPKNPIISQPYIFSTDQFTQKWKNIFSKEKRPIIGINWQGSTRLEKTYQGRSIPLETFSLLFKQNELSILSLQKGFGSEQLEQCSFKNKFVECQPQINSTWDFLENAAIIQNCDLIITCDTSIAHLAGGMGKKVWLLLRDIPFWTWGLKEETTFWYPSMRLFRQHERHNWQEVMERVSIALKKEICK